ncbi:MAG: TAXI family TRAP transporter solute-binding subunit [Aliarcobacter sp.]|jgi:TRAP transporter TAXI family solute receptor|nr:TAXI family TRAP transporter solute-binding subunit [Aliarcobacter sp.]MBP7224913.1 TAXI family TRAP transporter solute-binding subunit [Aliarcobacter sp.]MDX9959985.1 TAXI family TRAP transporter solute-binding subunit [Aliarcobacter sp.]
MTNKFFTISIPILLLIIASFYFTSKFIQPSVKKEITIATGSIDGEYYKTALQYKELLEKQKVKVNIVTSNGSLENIELLNEKKVDIAFVQNGIEIVKNENNLQAIASVYYEPLWIFYKNEDYKINYIIQLISKKISIGNEGSGTKDLALKLLKDNGLDNTNTQISTSSNKEAKDLLLKGEIDAMFMISSADSQIVKELLENPNITLFNFKRAKAYSRKYTFLESNTLYEGTIDLYKNLPYEDINLLMTSANLIVRDDFSDELIRLILKEIKPLHNKKALFEADNQFPNINNISAEINENAQRYFTYGDTWLEKLFPYWIASNIDRLKILLIPLITLMLPLSKGFFPLYRWSIRSKIYKWYKQIQKIDLLSEDAKNEDLQNYLKEISKLKHEIKAETKVPLSYMGEYYDLIMHLELIITKINSKLTAK